MNVRLIIFMLLIQAKIFAQDSTEVSKELFAKITNETKIKLERAGYMWSRKSNSNVRLLDSTTTLAGWEGCKIYTYDYKVPGEIFTPNLRGKVMLYNPSPAKIVRWVINALIDCGVKLTEKNIDLVIENIREQSGFQFPVRGVVYEDLGPNEKPDGFNETYIFFDGVTIEHKDFHVSSINHERITEQQTIKCLNMKFEDVHDSLPKYPKGKGRISSTGRDEYAMIFKTNTKGRKWTAIVREEYKKAMNSDKNNLIFCTVKCGMSNKKFKFE